MAQALSTSSPGLFPFLKERPWDGVEALSNPKRRQFTVLLKVAFREETTGNTSAVCRLCIAEWRILRTDILKN